jgi:hypothetical protein
MAELVLQALVCEVRHSVYLSFHWYDDDHIPIAGCPTLIHPWFG